MATDLNGLEKEKLIYIPVGNYAKYCLFKDDDKVLNIINNFSCSKDGLIPLIAEKLTILQIMK